MNGTESERFAKKERLERGLTARQANHSPLLIELTLILLFFALSAALLVQLFAAAYEKNRATEVNDAAALQAVSLAEGFAARGAGDSLAEYLIRNGFMEETPGVYARVDALFGADVRFEAAPTAEPTDAGRIESARLTAYDLRGGGARAILTIPITKYIQN